VGNSNKIDNAFVLYYSFTDEK